MSWLSPTVLELPIGCDPGHATEVCRAFAMHMLHETSTTIAIFRGRRYELTFEGIVNLLQIRFHIAPASRFSTSYFDVELPQPCDPSDGSQMKIHAKFETITTYPPGIRVVRRGKFTGWFRCPLDPAVRRFDRIEGEAEEEQILIAKQATMYSLGDTSRHLLQGPYFGTATCHEEIVRAIIRRSWAAHPSLL
ncbi:hypothetical protein OC845_005561 [Tilletia horrida]|nr:hypothetical protein OC845_005561 [Tilletia horrida]